MSFPILKAKDGNEFYNKYLDSITSFGNMYVAPDIFGKNAVLVPNKTKRPLTKKEIETFVKIYLLPKLNLFYSKIDYTFTENADNYYKYYYNSLNKFDNLCRFYLNLENPAVKRINFEIHQKMILDQKKSNSNKSFYDEIIKNNEEVVGILEIFSNIFDKLIAKNKAIRLKYTNINKMINELQADYDMLLGNNIINNNTINNEVNNPNFQDKINKMITKLGNLNPVPANYDELNNKIKLYKTKYLDFLKKYQTLLLTLKTLDIDISGFDLDKVFDFDTANTGIKAKLNAIYVESYNFEQIYSAFKKNIVDKIKKIKEININIGLLKSLKTNNSDHKKILDKIKFDDIKFLENIPANVLITNATGAKIATILNFNFSNISNVDNNTIKTNDFFKLLFYSLGYIRNNMIKKLKFFDSTNTTLELGITGNNSETSKFITLKKSIEEFQKYLEDNEDNINEKIKTANDTKDDLQADLDTFDKTKYDEQLSDINKKITEKNDNIKTLETEIRNIKTEINKYRSSKAARPVANHVGIDAEITRLEAEQNAKQTQIDTTIPAEKVVLENEKKKFTLLKFKEETNYELLTKKIKLQDELNKKYGELKLSNPFKDFKPEEFIAFDESLKKFSKSITKESSKTSKKNIIVSYFTENYLYTTFLNLLKKNKITLNNLNKEPELLKKILQLFYNKSKPLIITNKNKEAQHNFNENFIEKINNYINNTKFKEFIENADNEFKSTISKLLKKYKNENKFKCIDEKINIVDNITNLNAIINKCITSELNYEKNNKSITKKIFPYTNFIIAYFAIYLIIINIILDKINKDSTENINKIILESSMMELN